MAQVLTKIPVKNIDINATTFARFFDRFPSFWRIQIAGWTLYLVMMYVTFLTVAAEGTLFRLFEVKVIRTIIGFSLTCVMRSIYRRFGTNLSIQKVILLVLCSSIIFGSVWTVSEMAATSLRNPNFTFANNLARIPRNALDYGLTLTAWSALYFGIKYWREWQTERENALAERENALAAIALANQAQLEMLRYQLNPHFLFNSLNSIRALIGEDATRAKLMVTQIADFLRHSLQNGNIGEIALADEIEAARNYLAIEKVRFEEKLIVSFDIEESTKKFLVPCFLLNPLVENAVKHGLNGDGKPLEIRVSARIENNALRLEVVNTGTFGSNAKGTKIGLKNVRERLAKLFPGKSSFELFEENGLVRALIIIETEERKAE
jgi:signal transduction histidine kinase